MLGGVFLIGGVDMLQMKAVMDYDNFFWEVAGRWEGDGLNRDQRVL